MTPNSPNNGAPGQPGVPPPEPVIYIYSRKEAVEDGQQIAVPADMSRQAGIAFPVYLTRAAWCRVVEVTQNDGQGQDEIGRMWDVLNVLRWSIVASKQSTDTLHFWVAVQRRRRKQDHVRLRAEVGPLDYDQPEPAITIMLSEED